MTRGLLVGVALAAAGDGKLAAILSRIDDMYREQASFARMRMKVVAERYTRELSLEAWSQGEEKALVRITAPRKEQGTATLKVGKDIWNYLPKINRVIKVPSSMMGGAWMGSHFTHDDLVQSDRLSRDYDCAITVDGHAYVEVTCTPKASAAVVWGKVVAQVRPQDYLPMRVFYHDEDLDLVRTMTFADYAQVGGRKVARRMRVEPHDKPAEYTEVRYDNLEFDPKLKADLFTLKELQR